MTAQGWRWVGSRAPGPSVAAPAPGSAARGHGTGDEGPLTLQQPDSRVTPLPGRSLRPQHVSQVCGRDVCPPRSPCCNRTAGWLRLEKGLHAALGVRRGRGGARPSGGPRGAARRPPAPALTPACGAGGNPGPQRGKRPRPPRPPARPPCTACSMGSGFSVGSSRTRGCRTRGSRSAPPWNGRWSCFSEHFMLSPAAGTPPSGACPHGAEMPPPWTPGGVKEGTLTATRACSAQHAAQGPSRTCRRKPAAAWRAKAGREPTPAHDTSCKALTSKTREDAYKSAPKMKDRKQTIQLARAERLDTCFFPKTRPRQCTGR